MRNPHISKTLGLLAAFAMGTLALNAQQLHTIPQVEQNARKAVPVTLKAVDGFRDLPNGNANGGDTSQRDVVIQRQTVGSTTYDLQTNASMPQLVVGADGAVSVAWMQSFQASPFNDRGSGYNHDDGTGWQAPPEARVESAKTGWTSLDRLGDGRDIVAGHSSPVTLGIHVATSVPGSGVWEDQVIPNGFAFENGAPVGHLWPRMSVGGQVGEYVHVISLSLPSYFSGGAPYEGMEGALLYYRSDDYGVTWTPLSVPGVSSNEFVELLGDQYAIHARGTKVAIALFNGLSDTVVLISEDNGDTWTSHTIIDFPVDLYTIDMGIPTETAVDFDGDGIAQEYVNSDGGGTVHIDENGTVHVAFGAMHYSDVDLGDGQYEYYPTTNGLLYWREDFGPDSTQTIAYAQDQDGNGTLDLMEDLAYYRVNLSGMPSLGSAEDGTLVLSYAAIMENHFTSTQNYRHIHVVHSTDHGDTWNTESPCNVTPDPDLDGFEAAFASLPHEMGANVDLLYLRDFEPGVHIIGDGDPWGTNEMVHMRFAVSDLADCSEVVFNDIADIPEASSALDQLRIYPNPARDAITLSGWNNGEVSVLLLNALGQTLQTWPVVTPGQSLALQSGWAGIGILEITSSTGRWTEKIQVVR